MSSQPTFKNSLREHWNIAITLRKLQIRFDPDVCTGVWECYQVCPVDCWEMDETNLKAVFQNPENCIACNACVLQCPQGAIDLLVPSK